MTISLFILIIYLYISSYSNTYHNNSHYELPSQIITYHHVNTILRPLLIQIMHIPNTLLH